MPRARRQRIHGISSAPLAPSGAENQASRNSRAALKHGACVCRHRQMGENIQEREAPRLAIAKPNVTPAAGFLSTPRSRMSMANAFLRHFGERAMRWRADIGDDKNERRRGCAQKCRPSAAAYDVNISNQ